VEQLVRRNTYGLGVPAYSLTPPGLLGYEPAASVTAPLNVKKPAKEIDLKIMIHSVYESQYSNLMREALTSLQNAGFRCQVVESKGEFRAVEDYPEVHLNFTRWYADYPDVDSFMYSLLHSKIGVEGSFIKSSEIDALIEKGRTEADPTKRHSCYRQIEEILRKQSLLLPLFYEKLYCFSRPQIEGLELNYFSPFIPLEKLSIRKQ
jgi:ABC-type oligopeptide transport system substrate-binding subunit